MFPRTNPNFATGRIMPPSKNANYQQMFQNTDPYAKAITQNPGLLTATPERTQQLAATMTAAPPPTMQPGETAAQFFARIRGLATPQTATAPAPAPAPVAPATTVQTATPATTTGYSTLDNVITQFGAGGGATASDIFGAMRNLPPTPDINPDEKIRNAAQALVGPLSGIPSISPQALERLKAGYPPDLNMISPSFFQNASPTLQEALKGLYSSVSIRPEDLAHTYEQYTPRSLR